jgi:hypothetical protein
LGKLPAKAAKPVEVRGDVSTAADVAHLFEETRKSFGGLAISKVAWCGRIAALCERRRGEC